MAIDVRRPWARPSLLVPIGVVVALAVAFAIDGGGTPVAVAGSVVILGLAVYATTASVLAARDADGRLRLAWNLIAVALGARAVGYLLWIVSEYLLDSDRIPASAAAFYLLSGFMVIVAITRFRTEPLGLSGFRIALEGVTVALCAFLLAWILALQDVYDIYRADSVAFCVAVVYPLVDIAALAVAVAVLARVEARQRAVVGLLVFALGLKTIADTAFTHALVDGQYRSGGLIDIGWAAGLVAVAVAAQWSRCDSPPPAPSSSVPSNASLWVPYVPLLVAGTLGPAFVMSGVEAIIVMPLVVSVCLRQGFAAWENRQLLSAAAEQALRDPLTGLANRTLFRDRLTHAMMLLSRGGGSVAVVSLDLDDFKLVNESLGHPAADRLLIHAGERVAECVRQGDTVARLGGDEFALLLEGDVDEAHLITQRVVESFNEPFVIEGQQMMLRPSVGLAVATAAEPDLDPDELLARADLAMYSAKKSRSSRVHTFDADTMLTNPEVMALPHNRGEPDPGSGAARVRLLGELRHAIDNGDLDMVYQPKVGLRSKRTAGVEALLRWPHPELGVLRPDAFMSLVRQHGLMRPVTDLVLTKVLDDSVRWMADGVEVPVAVNLFAPYLRDTELPERLRRALVRRSLPAAVLTVEITEDVVLHELELVTSVLRELQSQGIRVAIDDFGSGYSALSYLRVLPIDEIKLDRQFLFSVTEDRRAAAVVRAVIELAHDLGIIVVAEGIEGPETMTWLSDNGCDIGQGYFFGRPIEADGVPALFTGTTRMG